MATIVTHSIGLRKEIITINNYKKIVPYNNIEYKFEILKEFTQGIEFMGYYTDDPELKNEANAKLYSHAQFALAPTVLELNNLDHEYTLFVCADENVAMQKIAEIGAVPLRENKFGMILAQRKKP